MGNEFVSEIMNEEHLFSCKMLQGEQTSNCKYGILNFRGRPLEIIKKLWVFRPQIAIQLKSTEIEACKLKRIDSISQCSY